MARQPLILRNEEIRQRALALIAALDLKTTWQVTVAPYRKNRSREQNNLYHSWIGIIARETGNSHDDMHDFCKGEFLPPRFIEVNGQTRQIAPSTTALKVPEMTEYMDKVYAWATSELGLLLPLPEDLGRRPAICAGGRA